MSQPLIYQRVRLCANLFWFDLVSFLGAIVVLVIFNHFQHEQA
jgi:hypothetical protein